MRRAGETPFPCRLDEPGDRQDDRPEAGPGGRDMKNPWMSAWLSAANSMTGAARGQMAAELTKQQTYMMREWQRASMEMWKAMMMPWAQQGRKRKR
jgi:hypothetical protein